MENHAGTSEHNCRDMSCKGMYMHCRGRAQFSSITAFISSDVISDMRINIREEGSDKVLWYKVITCRIQTPQALSVSV